MTGEGFGGLWAHSLDKDGKIDRQIRILRQARPGAWLVQNYSWIDGTPTTISVVTESCLEDGAHCILLRRQRSDDVRMGARSARA